MTITNRYTVAMTGSDICAIWTVLDDNAVGHEGQLSVYQTYETQADAQRTAARLNALQRDTTPGAWRTDPEVLEVERTIEEAQRRQRIVKPLLLVLLLACAAPTAAQTAPTAALIVGSAFDLTSSVYALRQPGTRESNPFLSHGGTAGLVAGKAATTGALVWVLHRLSTSGHPTAARVIGFGGGALLTSIAIRNTRVAR